MSRYDVVVTCELEDGRELECKYSYIFTQGYVSGPPEDCYPDETEADEPTYYLDGNEVDYSDLDTWIAVIADEMYEADEGNKKFLYKADLSEDDGGPDDY